MTVSVLGWWALAANLTACAVNIGMTVLNFRRSTRRLAAAQAAWAARFEALLPAVGVCWMLAEDEAVPPAWREIAKHAIPDGITVTKTPLAPSSTRWTH